MTCESIQFSSESDGLLFFGLDYPYKKSFLGHYVALVIWPNEDFHWLRLDDNGLWSHKPGETQIKNTDNSGFPITNPRTMQLFPYSIFCGYFLVIPSKIKIK